MDSTCRAEFFPVRMIKLGNSEIPYTPQSMKELSYEEMFQANGNLINKYEKLGIAQLRLLLPENQPSSAPLSKTLLLTKKVSRKEKSRALLRAVSMSTLRQNPYYDVSSYKQIVFLLIENKVNIDYKDKFGNTALLLVACLTDITQNYYPILSRIMSLLPYALVKNKEGDTITSCTRKS